MGLGQRPARRPRVAGVAVSAAVHAAALAVWAARPAPPAPPPRPRAPIEVRILRPGGLRPPAPVAPATPAALTPPARPPPRRAPAAPVPPRAVEPLRNPAAETGPPAPAGGGDEPVPDQAAEAGEGEGVVGGVPEAVATGSAPGQGATAPPDSPWAREHTAEIRRRVLARLGYPPLARAMGWEGVVVVAFLIVPGGQATGIAVARSSGHEPLDRAALEAVAASEPLPSPPSPQAILLPIRFRQER